MGLPTAKCTENIYISEKSRFYWTPNCEIYRIPVYFSEVKNIYIYRSWNVKEIPTKLDSRMRNIQKTCIFLKIHNYLRPQQRNIQKIRIFLDGQKNPNRIGLKDAKYTENMYISLNIGRTHGQEVYRRPKGLHCGGLPKTNKPAYCENMAVTDLLPRILTHSSYLELEYHYCCTYLMKEIFDSIKHHVSTLSI